MSTQASDSTPAATGLQALRLRLAHERLFTQLPWLRSWHSFSFGEHWDPRWSGFGPLRVLNDDTIQPGCGFGMHPHRNMEIVTVMVEGELEHRDSLGNGERLRSGEVQCMSAGTGITHSEWNGGDQPCRLLQIWIEPGRSALAPSYRQAPFQIGPHWTLLVDPGGSGGALPIARSVRFWRSRPAAGSRLALPRGVAGSCWLQLIDGEATLQLNLSAGASRSPEQPPEQPLRRGDGVGFAAGAIAALQAGVACDLLLMELG